MGAQEEVGGVNSASCRRDAATCMAAASRLRNRPMWHSSRNDLHLSEATSRLLESLGRALTRGPTAVPPPVRRAALYLARRCGDSSSPTSAGVDRDGHTDSPCPPPGSSGKPAARPRDIPFSGSIRLGRMG